MSLIRSKLEYASCVWNTFYDVLVDRVERVQRRFIRFALRGLGWTDIHDLPPNEDRCTLLHLDTPTKRGSIACVMFIFDVLMCGRVNSPNLLSVLNFIAPRYPNRGTEFLRIDFHRTIDRSREPMSSALRQFNEVIGFLILI
jgi:hypothetical protein